MSGHFDETDLQSYYYTNLTLDDAKEILHDQDQGVFLVRDSSRGGYVVCLKEGDEVTQYPVKKNEGEGGSLFVRKECPFKDLPSLLSFYKRNLFKSSALLRPVERKRVEHELRNQTGRPGTLMCPLEYTNSDNSSPKNKPQRPGSAPAYMITRPSSTTNMEGPPVYARAIKARNPISYETSALPLKIGDIIKVTRRKDGQGYGEIISNGKKGNFPLTFVELIENFDALEADS